MNDKIEAPAPRPAPWATRLDTTEDPPTIKRWNPHTERWQPDGTMEALVRALRLAAAALHAMPPLHQEVGPEHHSARAAALVTIQAGVAMAEGRPFDSDNTDLMSILRRARDSIMFLTDPGRQLALGPVLEGIARKTAFEIQQMIGGPEFGAVESLLLEDARDREHGI